MARPVCRIQIFSGGENREIEVTKTTFILGRGENADVKVSSSGVSRAHLSVEIRNGEIWVKDMTSANGTRLNGKKLSPNQAVQYKEGQVLNLGLADDTLKIKLLDEPTGSEDIKLPPLPPLKPKIAKEDFPPKIEVLKPAPAKMHAPKEEIPIDIPHIESTIIDPEYRKPARVQTSLAGEEIMEEARAAALKLKIAAEGQAAKIIQEAREKVLLEMSKAKDKAEAMIAEASDQAFKLQRQGEAEVAQMRQGMQESLKRLNNDFEGRSEELLKEARATATTTKAEAQKEADKIVALAYQKATEIKIQGEAELKIILKDEKKKAELLVEAAQEEADKILQETRTGAALLRKNVEREIEEIKAQAQTEANIIRTEAIHEGQQEADRIKSESQKLADTLLSRAKEQSEAELSQIAEAMAENKAEIDRIKADAQRHADSLLTRTQAKLDEEKIRILESANEEAEKIKSSGVREAKKEALTLLRLAESDRSGLTQAVEKLKQEVSEIEKKKTDLINSNKLLQKKNTERQADLDEVKNMIAQTEGVLATKMAEVENLNNEVKKALETSASAEESIKSVRDEKKLLLRHIEELKKDEEKLGKDFQTHQQQVEAEKARLKGVVEKEVSIFKEAAMAEVKALREKAQKDFTDKKSQQEEELTRMRMTELNTIKGLRDEEEKVFAAQRKHQILEISKALETYVIPRIKESLNWSEVPKSLENFFVDVKDIVGKVLDGQFSDAAANTAMDISKSRPAKSAKKRNTYIIIGAGLAAVIFVLNIPMSQDGVRKPASAVFLEKLREKEAHKPKFDPKLTDDYKNSYTDNVLYTRDYANFKLNPDNQGPWIKDLNKFFIEKLALNENAIVKFISVETSLVGQLKDLRAVVHIENQKEDIKKMTDAEKSSVAEMISILGSQEKYNSFRDFEKQYLLKGRQPAAQSVTSP